MNVILSRRAVENSRIALFITLLVSAASTGTAQPAPTAEPSAPIPTTTATVAPARSADEAFLRLQVGLGAINERVAIDKTVSAASATALQAQIGELQDLFASREDTENPDYVASLDLAARAMTSAAMQPDAAAANRTLNLLQRDIQVKLISARAAMGAEGRDPDSIPVVITTMRGQQKVGGYSIKATGALYSAAPPQFSFNDPTNPSTSRKLPPGVYILYAYRNNQLVARQDADFGLDGEAEGSATVLVP